MARSLITSAVYEVLKLSGKPVKLKDIYRGVKARVPTECDDTNAPCPYCGGKHPKWTHDVRSSLQSLKRASLVKMAAGMGKGLWQVTKTTKARASMAVASVPTVPVSLHKKLKEMIKEIGERMCKVVIMELPELAYLYDVVWMMEPGLRATQVFEVQDKGSLDLALSKLQHAYDKWKAELFIVVVGEKDKGRLQVLLSPLLTGAFHRIRDHLQMLTPEDVEEIHGFVTVHSKIFKSFLET